MCDVRRANRHRSLDRSVGWTARLLVSGLAALVLWILFAATRGRFVWVVDRIDRTLMRPLLAIRSDSLTASARDIDDLTSGWAIHIMRWATFIALVAVKRFRHLLVYLAALATSAFVAQALVHTFQRPRPYGVEILGDWDGFAHPSLPIVALTSTLAGICLTLVPAGRARRWCEAVTLGVLLLVGTARIYLATDHPTDVLFGALLTGMIMVVFFRVLVARNRRSPWSTSAGAPLTSTSTRRGSRPSASRSPTSSASR